jgi:hypothetical protein
VRALNLGQVQVIDAEGKVVAPAAPAAPAAAAPAAAPKAR